MKKIILSTLLCFSLAQADVNVIKPYTAVINYDTDSANSLKNKGTLSGAYYSRGNLGYLLEIDASYTQIEYKDPTTDSIKQSDATIMYSKYYPKYMLKGGLHYLNTSDTVMGNAMTLIAGISGFKWKYYDKITSGIDLYYTKFASIDVAQISPYFVYSKAININTRNNLAVKLNYIYADSYTQKNYTSIEITDTLLYKRFILTTQAYFGEMKSAVRDGGFTLFNTQDLLKSGYSLKVGYIATKKLSFQLGYSVNNFVEDGLTNDTQNSVAVVSATYNF